MGQLRIRLVVCAVLFTISVSVATAQVRRPRVDPELDPKIVNQAIARAINFLRRGQNHVRGSWSGNHPIGATSLCTLALLNAGVAPEDPQITKALNYLRREQTEHTYSVSLQTMVFCTAFPKRDKALIARNVEQLENKQIKTGAVKGGWDYGSKPKVHVDNSNSQFALLALHEAERAGVKVKQTTWNLAFDYWKRGQHKDGSWSYKVQRERPGYGSMTCGGIASLIIAAGKASEPDATLNGNKPKCCGRKAVSQEVEEGLRWLTRNFTVGHNPRQPDRTRHYFYYLYGLERVGRLTAHRFIGERDWYRLGTKSLLAVQDKFGFWLGEQHGETEKNIATSFALLFLSKGRRPILIGKAKFSKDAAQWNNHRHDLDNLTRFVENRWEMDLTWQVVDLTHSELKVEDLLQTPVLFISVKDELVLNIKQKRILRAYVDNGGFLFVEKCCPDGTFNRKKFSALMKDELLFPKGELTRINRPDHPFFSADIQVDARHINTFPLYGIHAGCRTSVVYSDNNISCYWELGSPVREVTYPVGIRSEIDFCEAIGANILAYATDRQLKFKYENQGASHKSPVASAEGRGVIFIAKLLHPGGCDEAPRALSNLLRELASTKDVRVSDSRLLINITDPSILKYLAVFMHGRKEFSLTEKQRKALRKYLDNGGTLIVDSISSNKGFTRSFRREMSLIFPEKDRQMKAIPADHAMFRQDNGGDDIRLVTLRRPIASDKQNGAKVKKTKVAPKIEGIEVPLRGADPLTIAGKRPATRYSVLFSPYDISCALENHESLQFEGYSIEDAKKIGMNLLLYTLQQ